ncbi:lipid droplet assembly factor 1-like [Cheilinus undulatus]|uniref:lipid droplet assembly factor 1-like n=1 Tax=Cheilinus undulatus TaxID=241271 RepID=UPI001BD3AC2E|nr:lipid droplet assembly factor 1-like [Cheilinus undulatus]
MAEEMQLSSSSGGGESLTEFQQLWGSMSTQFNRLYEDPRVTRLMNTRVGLYLSSHPVLALTAVLFSALAVLPVGLFLSFAVVTSLMSAAGFVFFEVFLLFIGGVTLLSVLAGIALFSVVASFITNVLYFIVSNILNNYYPKLIMGNVQEEQSQGETSGQKQK